MKSLLILRHGKSSWSDPGLSDHDRPLKQRGICDVPRMAALIEERALVPGVVLSSTAARASATAELACASWTDGPEIHRFGELYLASPRAYRELLAELPDTLDSAMVVGHNPGLEELAEELTGEPVTMPTAALAHVRLPIEHWSELAGPVAGELAGLWLPKEL